MELIAQIHPLWPESQRCLEQHLNPLPKPVSARYGVRLSDPVLPRLLAAGEATRGFWIGGQAVFTQSELAEFSHFEAVCRYVVRATAKDDEFNHAAYERSEPVDAGGNQPVKIPRRFALTTISMKPNMIGNIGEWTGEYVVGDAFAQVIAETGLTGYDLAPIVAQRTRIEHLAYRQLFCDRLLPLSNLDCSVESVPGVARLGTDDRLRLLGNLSYAPESLERTHDFNRTAEPWGGAWGQPAWVVSKRVVELFKTKKLKGWAFRPVLVTGTAIYRDYLEQWTRLCRLIADHPKSKFDGGR